MWSTQRSAIGASSHLSVAKSSWHAPSNKISSTLSATPLSKTTPWTSLDTQAKQMISKPPQDSSWTTQQHWSWSTQASSQNARFETNSSHHSLSELLDKSSSRNARTRSSTRFFEATTSNHSTTIAETAQTQAAKGPSKSLYLSR